MIDKPTFSNELLEQNGIKSNQMDYEEKKHMRLLIEKEERKIQMMNVIMFVLKLFVGIFAAGFVIVVLMFLFAMLSYQAFSVEATGPSISTSTAIIISSVFFTIVLIVVGVFYNRSIKLRQQIYNSRLERIENMLEKLMTEKENK
jgi:uncharacterized integral membrane protein